MMTNFLGYDQFIWFIGVVENREDPEKLGRVQVRIFGHHTEKKEDIPTDDLHWAWVIQPVSSAAINGIGDFSLGVVEGTWVVGFFMDSMSCQKPVIFGTIGSISGGPYPYPMNQKTGFLDPGENLERRPRKPKERIYKDGEGVRLVEETRTQEKHLYPREEHPLGATINENDINRLARAERLDDTILFIKKTNIDKGVEAADGTVWEEPQSRYNAVYPFNKVKESESGHIIEIDDTKDFERLHIWHRSGSFMEIYPSGAKVEKIVKSEFSIIMGEKYEHIMNRYNLTVDGPYNLMVFNPANIIVTGDCNIRVGGTATIQAGNALNLEAESVNIKASSNVNIQSGSKISLKSGSISSNPPISQAIECMKANGLGVVRPAPPQPGSPSISVKTERKEREYPLSIEK
ncbi:MAG: phage baseplate assembly protein V [Patescibacteria group bacterium]|nr:phage baseplate assembly protein V [Patescibacteria group bacterium]